MELIWGKKNLFGENELAQKIVKVTALQLQGCRPCYPDALHDPKGLPSPNSFLLTGQVHTCDHAQRGMVSATSVEVNVTTIPLLV